MRNFDVIDLIKLDLEYNQFVNQLSKIKHSYKKDGISIYVSPKNKKIGQVSLDRYCIKKDLFSKLPYIINSRCDSFLVEKAEKVILMNKSKYLKKDDIMNSDKPFSSKYYFIGKNPDNYLFFSGACYRIISIAQNGTIKLIYEGIPDQEGSCIDTATPSSGNVALLSWDENRNISGNFEVASTLKNRLDQFVKDGLIDTGDLRIDIDSDVLADADWYVGMIEDKNLSLENIMNKEQSEVTSLQSKMGLINISDYLKVSSIKNNYLVKENYQYWTLQYSVGKKVWLVMNNGIINDQDIIYSHEYRFSGTRPVIYLKRNTRLMGKGTEENPYIVVK